MLLVYTIIYTNFIKNSFLKNGISNNYFHVLVVPASDSARPAWGLSKHTFSFGGATSRTTGKKTKKSHDTATLKYVTCIYDYLHKFH